MWRMKMPSRRYSQFREHTILHAEKKKESPTSPENIVSDGFSKRISRVCKCNRYTRAHIGASRGKRGRCIRDCIRYGSIPLRGGSRGLPTPIKHDSLTGRRAGSSGSMPGRERPAGPSYNSPAWRQSELISTIHLFHRAVFAMQYYGGYR